MTNQQMHDLKESHFKMKILIHEIEKSLTPESKDEYLDLLNEEAVKITVLISSLKGE